MKLQNTKNDIAASTRKKLVELFNARLADAVDLQSQCKQAHWNVKGANFIALHELFDEIAEATEEYVDLIAERVTQLGGTALGTARVAAKASTLKEYPLEAHGSAEHVAALSDALAAFGAVVRKAIDEADDLGDAGGADIFTEISRGVDKWLWFVESHLG